MVEPRGPPPGTPPVLLAAPTAAASLPLRGLAAVGAPAAGVGAGGHRGAAPYPTEVVQGPLVHVELIGVPHLVQLPGALQRRQPHQPAATMQAAKAPC